MTTLTHAHSLRKRLLWFVLVAILLAAVLQAVTAYQGALRQADAMFDDHLEQVARSLRRGVLHGLIQNDGLEDSQFDLYVQIWGQDGTQIFRSTPSVLPPRAVLGFSEVEANGSRYRVYTLQTPLQTVQIAQDLSARTARARVLALRAVMPLGLLTPLLMLAVWWIINRSLAPIERARRQVAQRAADDFSPLTVSDLPNEVRPLVEELNLLFARVRSAFDAQRNFVADAAHELRSPLTALKLQAQALRGSNEVNGVNETVTSVHEAGVTRLNQGLDRAIRLVEQLLLLAREEASSEHPQDAATSIDLSEVVALAVADVLPLATAKNIDLGLTGETPIPHTFAIFGQREPLRVLLRNLLDNAVKYTPTGGQVDVSLQQREGHALLTVEDSGPGIADADKERAFDRFFRASETSEQSGSGLGLAIVKVIAERHHAVLTLGRAAQLGGLKVEVRFALAPSPSPAPIR